MFAFLNTKTFRALLLLLLFSISIFIRLPELRSDLNRESEWQTAHVLTTLSIWDENDISKHCFSPVWTFDKPADKFTNSLGGIKDKNNFTYYTSYPPFSFILPYFIFQLTGTEISATALKVFSLCVHFICALLVYLIAMRFKNNTELKSFPLHALIAFSVYLFSAGNLWFHGNFYFADSLVQLFILSSLYVFVSILAEPGKKQTQKSIALALFTFLGIYTEWLALFMSIIILLFLFVKSRQDKIYRGYILYSALSIILSLGIMVFQYSSIAGFDELKQHSLLKFSSRNGFNHETALQGLSVTNSNSFFEIYTNYIRHYNYPCLLMAICLLLLLWRPLRIKIKNDSDHIPISVLSVITLSILCHHILFFNFTAMHDVATLKTSSLFSLFFGYVVILFASGPFSNKIFRTAIVSIVCVLFIFISVLRYKLVVANNEDTYFQERTGKIIAEYSSPDEMVFTNIGVSPIMMWYSQRNPVMAADENECIQKMEKLNYNRGVFFKINTKGEHPFFESIRLDTE